MRNGGSKQKGSTFERAICKDLSLFVSNGLKEDCFWRSAMSGGRATLSHRKTGEASRVAGDICATSPEGHLLTDYYYFELKHYKDLKLSSFLFQTGPLFTIW